MKEFLLTIVFCSFSQSRDAAFVQVVTEALALAFEASFDNNGMVELDFLF